MLTRMALHPAGNHYRNQTIRLPDLAVTEDILTGLTFENCHIMGPAVFAPLGNTKIEGCSWDGDFDALIWPIRADREIIGAIGLQDCELLGCRLSRLGLVVREDQVDQVRRGFGL
jgi:hypothetical protein